MKANRFLGSVVTVLLILIVGNTVSQAKDLFNGTDLTGWTCGQSPWVVENGILKNTGAGNDYDFLEWTSPFPVEPFTFEIRMRMVSCTNEYPRPRIYMNGNNSLYIGNEGFTRQYEMYGDSLTHVQQVGDDSYTVGYWHTLRLVVDDQNKVSLYKDGVLTHTGLLTDRCTTGIVIKAGDLWSGGKIEISSIQYSSVPEPASLLLMGAGGWWYWRRKNAR